ncbi:uncharacterized protein LOC106166753 [Lingula anatina]|uniref:Uncharacterized protein LOC106166753 n=1 Tax=Lingula anatina TaxID=7574 RepID=A0A1S3IS09_LINAN|nr:uncharacterized protein LOC106166753 [Lingula anatina]|eukprot:XP_013400858.1 uncharacterized protein LOC106166753 [Lingula anatina]
MNEPRLEPGVRRGHVLVIQVGSLCVCDGRNLNILRHCQTVYIDGTFRVCPRPYTQLLVIVGNFHGYGLPLVHALIGQRTVGHYRQVLQAVCRRTRELTHHRWRPTLVVTDFEIGLQNAVQTEIPTADVRGCYFHFSQALWRKIQEIGLSNAYINNDRVKALVRKVMALGYLPLPLVRLNYNLLLQERGTRRQMRRTPALQEFLQCVSLTYVDRGATFNIPSWNVFKRGMEQRTNNIVESIHRAFSGAVQVRHHMFWNFLRHLKDQQAITEQRITAARNGNAPPPRNRKWRDL